MNIKKSWLFLLLLLVPCVSANAFSIIDAGTILHFNADFSVTLSPSSVEMGGYDSAGITATVHNNSSYGRYVSLGTSDDSSYIRSSAGNSYFYMGAHESRNVVVTVTTENAPHGNYHVHVAAESGNDEVEAVLNVTVYEYTAVTSIEMDPAYETLCRGNDDEISVRITNHSNSGKDVDLSAESEMFLPYFEPDEIYLSSGDSELVTLRVHTDRYTPVGVYSVNMYANSGGREFIKRAEFRVDDCQDNDNGYFHEADEFSLSVSGGCRDVEKGNDVRISYTLTNKTSHDIEVELALISDIPTEISEPVFLESRETKTREFTVKARDSDSTGRHNIAVHAWTEDDRAQEETCVNVIGKHSFTAELLNNNLEIEKGSYEVFTLRIKNNGDFKEYMDIEVSESYSAIAASISDSHFSLEKGEEEEVYISVSAAADASLGNYEIPVIVTDHTTVEKTIVFEVVTEATNVTPTPTTGMVEIVAYPETVKIKAGEESTFRITLKNDTGVLLTNIRAHLKYLPEGITLSMPSFDLSAGEARTIEGTIKSAGVEKGTYNGAIEFSNSEFALGTDISLNVEGESATPAPAPSGTGTSLAGLFALGTDVVLGIIILIIAIVVILAIAKLARSEPKKSQPWERE